MQHPRLVLATAAFGLLAAALPALASPGQVEGIELLDYDHDGKIDRAVLTVDNPSGTAWSVRGSSGLKIYRNDSALRLTDVFLATAPTADPVKIEVVLDEADPNLPTTTSADGIEVEYVPAGILNGISDGFVELAAIAKGDAGTGDTEQDKASPILLASVPAAGTLDVRPSDDLVLTFSEPIVLSSLTYSSAIGTGGWNALPVGDGSRVQLQHASYQRGATETFKVMAAMDAAGNGLAAGPYPNPFSFNTTTITTEPIPTRPYDTFIFDTPIAPSTLSIAEPAVVTWYSNVASAAWVRLKASRDGGVTFSEIATVPSSQGTYVWHPYGESGPLQLRLELLTAQYALLYNELHGGLTLAATAAPSPLLVAAAPVTTVLSETSARLSIKLSKPAASAEAWCNGSKRPEALSASGVRPVILSTDLTGLSPSASYACRFRLTDASGAVTEQAVADFKTGADTTPPMLLSAPTAGLFDPVAKTARLSWTTDEPSTAQVSYGPYLDYGSSASDPTLSREHSVTLTGLTPGGKHQARVTSIDAKGNASVSKDFVFIFLGEGDLVKGSGPAVYWYKGGKRYAFPNETVYKTWFKDFSKVILIGDSQLAGIPLGGNVRMREGVHLVKIQSDPKTYAVEPGGVLRWIPTEAQALALYGSAWSTRVRDVDVSLFTDYVIGEPLAAGERPVGYSG
jgi:hypothetical protein